jgi:peroxiredoxin
VDILGSKSSETASNLAEFMQTNNYTFPVLLDSKMSVTSNYGIQSTPTNFLIDRDGVIRYRQTGAFSSPQDFETKVNELLAK